MKRIVCLFAVLLLALLLCGCCLRHDMLPATCTEPATCSKCGRTEGEALGHTEETDPAVEPTCTETGLTEGKHCSVCGEVLAPQETVPALGHSEETDPAVEPTCTETGLTEGKHCSVCGEVLVAQETVPALGHDWEDATFFQPRTCRRCGETEGRGLGPDFFVEHLFREKAAQEPVEAPAAGKAAAPRYDYLLTARSAGLGMLDDALEDSSVRLGIDTAQGDALLLSLDLRLNGSEPLRLLFSFGKEGLSLALPGSSEAIYTIGYEELSALGKEYGVQGGISVSAPSLDALKEKYDLQELKELARRYAGILFSAANPHNTEERLGLYRLEGLDEEITCLRVTCTPKAGDWRSMFGDLLSAAKADDELQQLLGDLIRALSANPSFAYQLSGLGFEDAEDLIAALPQLFDLAGQNLDSLVDALDGFSFEAAVGAGRVYAVTLRDAYGTGLGCESFGTPETQRRDALVRYEDFDEAEIVVLNELEQFGSTVKGKLSLPANGAVLSYLFSRTDGMFDFDMRCTAGDLMICAALGGERDKRELTFDYESYGSGVHASVLRIPAEEALLFPEGERTVLRSAEDLSKAGQEIFFSIANSDFVSRLTGLLAPQASSGADRDGADFSEEAAASEASALFALRSVSRFSVNWEPLGEKDAADSAILLSVSDAALPRGTDVVLISGEQSFCGRIVNTDFEGQLAWDSDPFDPDGMTLVDSGVGVYDDSVYLDFLIIEDGEYFIIEYLFDPA